MSPKPFTIMEMIIVMAIMALVAGFVIARVGNAPAFVTLDDSVNRIKSVFLEASTQALVQARKVNVDYDLKKRRLTIATPPKEKELLNGAEELRERLMSYTIPEVIETTFTGVPLEAEKVTYCFYSDGSADGPAMNLTLKGHQMVVAISRLTGMVNVEEVVEE